MQTMQSAVVNALAKYMHCNDARRYLQMEKGFKLCVVER